MSSAKVYVSFTPSIPGNIGITPPNLTVTSADEAILFSFDNSPGMKFKAFSSTDDLRQLKVDVTDAHITITDIDLLPEHIHYTVSIADAQGQVFESDPQIINNPR